MGQELCSVHTASAVQVAARHLLGRCMRAGSGFKCVSPVSCWTSRLLKGVMKRLVCTLSSTRDAAMTCTKTQKHQTMQAM